VADFTLYNHLYYSNFSITTDAKGYLTLISSLKLASRVQTIRASFCPLLSLEKGEFIVTGSEDANVYFYDLARPKNSCVNKLQGHGSPVIGVAWNHGENLLASSDSEGTVIVWKRAKTN
jgi:WD40 repeat protein